MAQKGDVSLKVIHRPVPIKEKSGLQALGLFTKAGQKRSRKG